MLLPIFLLATGCSEPETRVTVDEIEALLQESEQQERLRTIALDDMVTGCMAENGFDFKTPDRDAVRIDLAPGLDRDQRIASIGSGMVAYELWRLDQEDASSDQPAVDVAVDSDPAEDQEYWDTLHESVEVDGAVVEGGCTGWAEEEYLRLHPEWELRMELSVAYADYMTPAFEDLRLRELDDEWASCMAADGFGGYHRLGDQFDDLSRGIAEIVRPELSRDEQRTRLEALKEFDIEVTVAAERCSNQIQDRRKEIFSEYSADFAGQYADQLGVLANDE